MEGNQHHLRQSYIFQDSRTGSLGVTLASKRRSQPDLATEEDSSSVESNIVEREYASTTLVTPRLRDLSQVVVEVKTSSEVELLVDGLLPADSNT